MRRRAYVILLIAMLSWGFGNPLSDLAMESVSVGEMLFLELGTGFAILTVVGLFTRQLRIERRFIGWATALGLLQPGLTYICGNLGYATGTVTTGLLLMQSEVIFLALFGWLFAHERISLLDFAAVVVGSLGALVVGWSAQESGIGDARSTAAFIVAAISTAGYGVIVRTFALAHPDANFFGLVWLQTLSSLILAAVLWPLTSTWSATTVHSNNLAPLAGVAAGLFGVAIPFLLYTHASKVVPAKHAAIALNVIPIAGISIGAFMGRGVPTSMQYLGGALVLASLFALTRKES